MPSVYDRESGILTQQPAQVFTRRRLEAAGLILPDDIVHTYPNERQSRRN